MQTLAQPTERDGQHSPAETRRDGPVRPASDRAGSFHRWMNRRWPVDPSEDAQSSR